MGRQHDKNKTGLKEGREAIKRGKWQHSLTQQLHDGLSLPALLSSFQLPVLVDAKKENSLF